MKIYSRTDSNKSVEYYVLTTKKTEHHTNRCSSESQLKLGSGLLDLRATQPTINREYRLNSVCVYLGYS